MIYAVGAICFIVGVLASWLALRARYDADRATVWVEPAEEGVVFRSFDADAVERIKQALDGERSYTVMRVTRPE